MRFSWPRGEVEVWVSQNDLVVAVSLILFVFVLIYIYISTTHLLNRASTRMK